MNQPQTGERNQLGLATVGLVTIKIAIVKSPYFLAGKAGDPTAADKLIQQVWSVKKTIQLQEYLKADSVFLTMPSSTRTNVIPIQLAQFLSQETRIPWINGDSIFNAKHSIASKNISRDKRLFHERKYSVAKKKNTDLLQNKTIFIVDDIITSGSSIRNYAEFLRNQNLNIFHVVALMGDRRLEIDQKTEDKLKELLNQKNIDIDFESIRYITRTEAGGLIRLLNNARSDNAIRKLTQNIHGIRRYGLTTSFKRNSGTNRHQSLKGQNRGNVGACERVQTDTGTPGVEWELRFVKNGKTLRSETIIFPGTLSKKEQLKKIPVLARQSIDRFKLGLVQIKLKQTGKTISVQLVKENKNDLEI